MKPHTVIAFQSILLQKHIQKRDVKVIVKINELYFYVKLFTWPGPVTLSVLYQVCCQLLRLTFVICWKHLVSVSTLRRRERVFGRGGRDFLFFGKAHVMFSSSPQTSASQKAFFIPNVYRETTPVHCCEMSRHISHAWQGSSPPPDTRGAQLSLVSAIVIEAVDRNRDRQTYVPSKIQEGRAFLFSKRPLSQQCIATPHCCLRRSCLTVSSWSQLKLSLSTSWNHPPLVHTHRHTFTHSHAQDTHTDVSTYRIKK